MRPKVCRMTVAAPAGPEARERRIALPVPLWVAHPWSAPYWSGLYITLLARRAAAPSDRRPAPRTAATRPQDRDRAPGHCAAATPPACRSTAQLPRIKREPQPTSASRSSQSGSVIIIRLCALSVVRIRQAEVRNAFTEPAPLAAALLDQEAGFIRGRRATPTTFRSK